MNKTNPTGGIEARTLPPKALLSPDYDVVVIGAGPYGLSAAAHLKAKGLGVRVFGEPMQFWATKMPAGMLLRSPRAASNLSDPRSDLTLDAYEAANGIKPAVRVALQTFVGYGRWFQNVLGSAMDRRMIAKVDRWNSIFRLTLADGDTVTSRRVVVAAGIGPFQKRPKPFVGLPSRYVSHCYDGSEFRELSGKRVAVIGAGQSALESAALLHESGANVEVIARIPSLRWIGMHKWLHNLGPISGMLYSKYDVGPVGISRLVAYPKLMTYIPLEVKDRIRVRAVRPAGSPWLGPRLTNVKITTGRATQSAAVAEDHLHLALDDGSERQVDHVLLGTGYKVDISQYPFLSPEVVEELRLLDGAPDLTTGFCSSVPGLHFIGATAARNFGPLLYFVAGTKFASKELATYIHRNRAVSR